jgi:multidrug efflux pump subunit AcrB
LHAYESKSLSGAHMLAIVRIALSRPYTFIVAALLIFLVGTLAALRLPVDIFPSINMPIIGVAWQYQGLPPDQMAGRIITPFERALTTTVNDIEHIEANSYTTFGIVKIFFHPSVNIATANAQVTAISQTLLKQMPPGATPPLIVNYSASTVPVIQLALSGMGLTEQRLADLGLNFVRTRLTRRRPVQERRGSRLESPRRCNERLARACVKLTGVEPG